MQLFLSQVLVACKQSSRRVRLSWQKKSFDAAQSLIETLARLHAQLIFLHMQLLKHKRSPGEILPGLRIDVYA